LSNPIISSSPPAYRQAGFRKSVRVGTTVVPTLETEEKGWRDLRYDIKEILYEKILEIF
jgi:hypothetical protein